MAERFKKRPQFGSLDAAMNWQCNWHEAVRRDLRGSMLIDLGHCPTCGRLDRATKFGTVADNFSSEHWVKLAIAMPNGSPIGRDEFPICSRVPHETTRPQEGFGLLLGNMLPLTQLCGHAEPL
eukprot:4453033-Karenia_brevis.AAC.1